MEERTPQHKVDGPNKGFNWIVELEKAMQNRDGCRKLIMRVFGSQLQLDRICGGALDTCNMSNIPN